MNLKQIAAPLLGLALVSGAAQASVTLISEGFDNVAALGAGGWAVQNNSTPGGSVANWFQGDQSQFGSQAGADNAYIAGNYNMAAAGGTLDAWLLTPIFSRTNQVVISFYARGAQDPNYSDLFEFGVSDNGGADPFVLNAETTVGTDGWTKYTVTLDKEGGSSTARFGIHYKGAADNANYIGFDSFTATAIPEPGSLALVFGALAGVAGLRRRAR